MMSGFTRRVVIFVIGLVWAGMCGAETLSSEAPPPQPWPGPTGAWVYVEGEDFVPQGAGWERVADAAQQISPGLWGPAVGRDSGLSGSPEGMGTASMELTVPAAGEYRIHVRLSQWPGLATGALAGGFQLEIRQGGKSVFSRDYGKQPIPAVTPPVRVSMRWQSHDETPRLATIDAVEARELQGDDLGELTLEEPVSGPVMDLTLAAGPATVIVRKLGTGPCHPAVRLFDCLLLTQDAAYVPNYRDFGPQVYARVTVTDLDRESAYIYMMVNHLRGPNFYRNTRFASDGFALTHAADPKTWLRPGQTSAWGNMSRAFDHDAGSLVRLRAMAPYNDLATRAGFEFVMATRPEEGAIYQRVQRDGEGGGIRVLIPWDAGPDRLPQPDHWYASQRLAQLEALGAPTFGRRPERFPLAVELAQRDGSRSNACLELETRIAAWLGVNAKSGEVTAADLAAGLQFGDTGASIWHMGPAGFVSPDLATMEAQVAASGKRLRESGQPLDRLLSTHLMDEASAPAIADMQHRENQEAFVAWVAERKLPVWEDPGLAQMEEMIPELTEDGAGRPRLYYYSQRFRAWTIMRFFQQATEVVHRHYPATAGTTQNFSDGPVWGSSIYAQGNDYWLWFQNRALDIATSEDWTNQGATPELAGWNVALLRSATKYHGQPIHMNVISSGKPPAIVKLKSYSSLAQGAKHLTFYAYSPEYGWHERGWGADPTMYPAIAELSREIGAAEDILLPAMPRRADVAIIYSRPTDIWAMAEPRDNTHGVERMFTWLALQHAQVASDVLTEADVIEGRLAPYRVAYLSGLQVDTALVAPLAKWVQAGGTLVLGPAAASRDEYNAPLATLDQALGLKRPAPAESAGVFHATAYIGRLLEPVDQVDLLGAQGKVRERVESLAWTQSLVAGPDDLVSARFASGDPAAVERRVGEGRVVLVGFMPGLAYLRSTHEPYRQAHAAYQAAVGTAGAPEPPPVAPVAWPAALREFIVGPAVRYAGPPPVELDTSRVEATFMESDTGMVVLLANWTLTPIGELQVVLRPGRPCRGLRSARLGELPVTTAADGSLHLTLPLGITDMLIADYLPQNP